MDSRPDGESKRHVQRYIALILWVVAGVIFVSLARQWIALTSSDKELAEYAQFVVQRAAVDRRTPGYIRNVLLMKAADLAIPLQHEQLTVTGQGPSIRAVIIYQAEIKLPLSNRVLYRLEFNHNLTHKPLL
jgi:hypothetical protein